MGVFVLGQVGSTLYGVDATSGEWKESTDHGVTWVGQGRNPSDDFGTDMVHELFEANGYRFVVDGANPSKLWRTTAGSYTGWTDITPAGMPAATISRPSIAAHNGSALLIGNYGFYTAGAYPGAYVWRSTDDGANWSLVINLPDSTNRHVHAIRFDPADATKAFVTIGDDPPGRGVYYSADSGATWTQGGTDRYGIDLAFPTTPAGYPERVYADGDGPYQPHVLAFWRAKLSTAGSQPHPHIWYDQNGEDTGGTWMASVRGSIITAEGNLFYISTSEDSAAYGGRYGVWLAEGPLHVAPVLLEELDGSWDFPRVKFGKTFESGAYLLNTRYRMTRPKFVGQ